MTDNNDETDDEPVDAEGAIDRLPSEAEFAAEIRSDDEEMTPREREAIDDRIVELEDESRRYSTEEVAEDLGVNLDRE